MHPALLALLQQRVTIEPYTEADPFGAPGYGPPVEYPARVVGEMRMVRTPDGEEVVSSTKVTIPGPPDGPEAVDPRSRITLPDGSQPPILAAPGYPDETGTIDHHVLRLA